MGTGFFCELAHCLNLLCERHKGGTGFLYDLHPADTAFADAGDQGNEECCRGVHVVQGAV